jgi:hypothetical protein
MRAFAAVGRPMLLAGGQGRAWRVDDVVLKPLDMSEAALRWQYEVLNGVVGSQVRVAAPMRTPAGELVVDGWTAWPYLEGRTEQRRWPDVIEAGDRLHDALRHLPEPAFLRDRTHNWAVGDRAAWDATSLDSYEHVSHIRRLRGLMRPVDGRAQVGIGIGGVASAGIRGNVNVVTVGLPVHVGLHVKEKPVEGQAQLQLQLEFVADVALKLATLAGRLALYVEYPFGSEEWELFEWTGFHDRILLTDPPLVAELPLVLWPG